MKKIIRLTESDLHRIVRESVKRVLKEDMINEYPYSPYPKNSKEDREWAKNTFTKSTTAYWKAEHPEWTDEQCLKAASEYDKNNRKN